MATFRAQVVSPATFRMIAAVMLMAASSGCSLIEFHGDNEKQFEFNFGWEGHGVQNIGKPDPATGGKYDKDGNLIPTSEVLATYRMPNISAGLNFEVWPKAKPTPTVNIEVFELKMPLVRWQECQIQVGAGIVDVFIGHRLTSIFDIDAGIWYGYDYILHRQAVGVGLSIIKF